MTSCVCCFNVVDEHDPTKQHDHLRKFEDYQRKAEMYYVYHVIQRYTVSPHPLDCIVVFCHQFTLSHVQVDAHTTMSDILRHNLYELT